MYSDTHEKGVITRHISGSPIFQLTVHYNAVFSAVFYPIVYILVIYKLETFMILDVQSDGAIDHITWPNYLLLGGQILSAVLEYLRLLEGIRGNSAENVPKLSAFGLLSFLQVCYLVGCIALLPQLLPLMLITNWILLVFIAAEFIFMGRTLQRLVTRQTASFFRVVQNEYSKVQSEDPDEHDARDHSKED